jgi:hypothetical protein
MWHAWERREKYARFWMVSPKERDLLEDRCIDVMGSEWVLWRLTGGCGVDSVGSVQGPVACCCEYGDEPSGSGTMELMIMIVINSENAAVTHFQWCNTFANLQNA